MAAGQYGRAESWHSQDRAESARRARTAGGAARRVAADSPAFISDQAQEQHQLDLLRDPSSDGATKAAARLELARLYERNGQFSEAAEMYERNIWAGARTPATYAGLAAAYRELGRDDLAEATLEQVRRQGGAGRANETARPSAVSRAGTGRSLGRPSDVIAQAAARSASTRQIDSRSRYTAHATGSTGARSTARRATATAPSGAGVVLDQIQQSVAPFLAGQAGRRTLLVTTVLLPIVVGLGIFAGVVLTSTRNRTVADAPTPPAAPVATVVPTSAPPAAPTSAIPAALAQQPAPAKLVVSNVGTDGLSLRQTPGTGQRLKVWSEGTEMADLGETAEVSGMTWRKVRDPDGTVGWTADEYLADPATRAAAAPAAPPFVSGGLGLVRAEWEKVHGQPSRSSIFLEYDGGRLVVGLLEGNIWHIERVWMRNDAVSLEAAREDARVYLPEDATLAESIDRGDGRIVDVYRSESLARRFGSTAWNGGTIGTFSIQYRFRSATDRLVTSAMYRLGDAQF